MNKSITVDIEKPASSVNNHGSVTLQGLSQSEASKRLEEYGPNRLPEPHLPGAVEIFFRQFLSPFIYILLIAAILSFVFQQMASGVFICAVLLLNAIIGTVQEYSAQQAAAALKKMVKGEAHVIRDGEHLRIDAEDLVPGDLVSLTSGDKIPADIKLLSTDELTVDESMLTGESLAVIKDSGAEVTEHAPLAERINRCFAGTIVTRGRGQGIVTYTGANTQIGKIAHEVIGGKAFDAPLMIRIRKFTYHVAAAIMLSILILILLMLFKGHYTIEQIVMMAIGLAVSTIPEGLPAALTVALAIGMQRMVKHDVIIRKLIAVEALGSCTFICSDKTGTLTVNELTIRKLLLPDGASYEVSGEGVAPGGKVIAGEEPVQLEKLCTAGILANESSLNYAGKEWFAEGDIVDVSFLVLSKKLGLSLSTIREQQQEIDAIPYESERAFSASLNNHTGKNILYVKGSPEKVLALSSHMESAGKTLPIDKPGIEQQFESLASAGHRVLALAYRETDSNQAIDALENLVFLGLVGMIDPMRPEARDAIDRCRRGGIEVAMVTGDHPSTARAIASELGIIKQDDPVITGNMIYDASKIGNPELDRVINSARVFARIDPQQKEMIVESLIRQGHYVAVTGDGVNDAPAMRHAHAGVAMGKRGTDVAKETAELIITDDNFSSIVDGIEQGRVVYGNIRKVIALLIATGFSALLLFFLTVFAGLPMPMIAVQLLWLNLVANGLQDVALAFEPAEGGELDKPPRHPDEPIFEKHIVQHVLVIGGVMGILAFLVFAYLINTGTGIEHARNLTLMQMVLFGNIHAFCSRSEIRSVFSIKFFSNPFLMLAIPIAQAIHISAMYTPGISDVLALQPITLHEWSILAAISLVLLIVEELHKLYLRKEKKPNALNSSIT